MAYDCMLRAYANDDLSKDSRSKNKKFKGLIANPTCCQMQHLPQERLMWSCQMRESTNTLIGKP